MKWQSWVATGLVLVGLWVLFRFAVPRYLGWAMSSALIEQADSLIAAERAKQASDSAIIPQERKEFAEQAARSRHVTDSLTVAIYKWRSLADSLYRVRQGRGRPEGGGETLSAPPRLTGTPSVDSATIAMLVRENDALRQTVQGMEQRHIQDSVSLLLRDDRILRLEKWQDDATARMATLTNMVEDLRDQSECYIAGIKALGKCPSRTVAAVGGAIIALVASR